MVPYVDPTIIELYITVRYDVSAKGPFNIERVFLYIVGVDLTIKAIRGQLRRIVGRVDLKVVQHVATHHAALDVREVDQNSILMLPIRRKGIGAHAFIHHTTR